MNHRTLAFLVALAPLATGCGSASASSRTEFLGDTSMLRQHPNYPGTIRWEKPGIDLRDYDSLMFDPVAVRVAPGSAAASLGAETLAAAAAKFDEVIVATISPFYSIVQQPGEHTLRVRVGLTDLRPDASDVDVGGATIEAELLDAVTGERLAAAVTRDPPATTGMPDSDDVPQRWRGVAGIFRERARRLLDFLDSHDVGGN